MIIRAQKVQLKDNNRAAFVLGWNWKWPVNVSEATNMLVTGLSSSSLSSDSVFIRSSAMYIIPVKTMDAMINNQTRTSNGCRNEKYVANTLFPVPNFGTDWAKMMEPSYHPFGKAGKDTTRIC